MYCLDCGQKIEDGQTACSNCGLSVDEIEDRIAKAQEKVTYAETVGPAKTTKLPPVPERVYYDKDGNIIDPAEEIDPLASKKEAEGELPIIGDKEDPYITLPIQKIVSDDGRVVAGNDSDVKVFIQPPAKKKGLSAKSKAIIVLVIVFAAIAVAVAVMNSLGVFEQSKILKSEPAEEVSEQGAGSQEENGQASDSQAHEAKIFKALADSYQTLGAYRGQVDGIVSSFNSFYLASDEAKRQQRADECAALIKSVSDSKATLIEEMNELGLKEDDPLFKTYQQINKLYELLLTRLNVIEECWDVSLGFDKPKGHEQEILAPLSKDIEQGKSASIAQFDALYPQVAFPEA